MTKAEFFMALDKEDELPDTEGCEKTSVPVWSVSDEVHTEDQAVRFR